ncbi:MAG TPA: DUF1576 domain-containing protein [Spirochaetaceae bacterium]|nr:DUF1576 domain-containing protein [Spirochaetaceae bacterium]
MLAYEKKIYLLLGSCCLAMIALGIAIDGPLTSLQGWLRLQTHAARLINDFTVIGGTGGALLNAGLMGLICLLLTRLSGVALSGPTVAATCTILGFSLFGKTPLNALPVVLGVFLASRIAGKPFKSYILMALFGTALGPLVSYLVFETDLVGLPAIGLGLLGGIIAGCALPALAMAMLRMHEGFNLYNMGLTCGFLGLFAAAGLAGTGHNLTTDLVWNAQPALALRLLVPILCILFLIWGTVLDGRKLWRNLLAIFKMSGRLPSDFMATVSPGAALVNAGLLGLAGSVYLTIIGAACNGPVIGGQLTVMGFATFGKHPRNCWPVAVGVIGATLLFGKSLVAPGPVLALLFGTTLAPLAGEFGPLVGMAAGFVHLTLVERSAAWHGGLDLYNNGFAGGLTATLFVAIIQWLRSFKTGGPTTHRP